MASQDQMTELIEKIKKQPQLMFLIGLAVLLVIRIVVFVNESGYRGDPEVKAKIIELKPRLTIDSAEYTNVNKLLSTATEERAVLDESFMKELVQNNIFDQDEVTAALANRAGADKLVTEGYIALGKTNYEVAIGKATDALAMVVNNRGALELQREIADKFVAEGYAALENEALENAAAKAEKATEMAEKALELVPGFAGALDLENAIAKSVKTPARGVMPPGMGLPGVPGGTAPATGDAATTQ